MRKFKVGDLVEIVDISPDGWIRYKPGVVIEVVDGKIRDYKIYLINEMLYEFHYEKYLQHYAD